MTLTRTLMLLATMCVGGLSFAAGRMATTATRVPVSGMEAAPVLNEQVRERIAPPTVPAHVPDMIALSFVDTYRLLKSAPLETIRSYCNELEQLPPGPKRNTALSAFFKVLIQVNPSMAKELILQLKKDERWVPLSAIREAALPRGMETVAEVLLSFDRIDISGCSYDLLAQTLDEWGKTDPLALKQFLEAHPGQDVERYFDKLVGNWAAYDPEAASEWMAAELAKRPLIPTRPNENGGEEIFDSEWRTTVEEMSVAWVRGLFAYDSEAAINYVLEHADNAEVQRALYWVAGDLFTMAPRRARDFVSRLSGESQTRSLESIAQKADALVRTGVSDNFTSPQNVAEWLLQFAPEAWQTAIGVTLHTWQSANPQEVFAWMARLPAETRTRVVRAFPSFSSVESAQQNFDEILQAEDPVLRVQLLEKLMRGAESAGAEMHTALENAALSADEKAHLAALIPAPDQQRVNSEATGGEQ